MASRDGSGNFILLPAALVVSSSLMWLAGYMLSNGEPNHFWRITLFALGCLTFFHLVFYVLEDFSNETSLRMVDYIYLGLAFFGVYGALDVQANILKARIPEIVTKHAIDYKKLTKCTGALLEPGCIWERSAIRVLEKPYDHFSYDFILRDGAGFKGEVPAASKPLHDAMKSLYDEVEASVYQHIDRYDSIANAKKIWAYYILCIAIALRMTKVSAEIFNWHVPKKGGSEALLPTD